LIPDSDISVISKYNIDGDLYKGLAVFIAYRNRKIYQTRRELLATLIVFQS
jgi:hypothetical protein